MRDNSHREIKSIVRCNKMGVSQGEDLLESAVHYILITWIEHVTWTKKFSGEKAHVSHENDVVWYIVYSMKPKIFIY
jgi:hypothetical protein